MILESKWTGSVEIREQCTVRYDFGVFLIDFFLRMEADLCWVSGEQCSGGGVGPMGRQGTALVRGGELLFCFGGRLEGKGRAYCDDFWKRPLGEGELWQQIEHAKSGGGAWPCARHNHALVAVSETMLLLHGGATHGEKKGKHFEQVYLGDIWTFDIAAGTWTKHEESPSWPHRHCHALHKENDGRLVLIWHFFLFKENIEA